MKHYCSICGEYHLSSTCHPMPDLPKHQIKSLDTILAENKAQAERIVELENEIVLLRRVLRNG